MDKRKDWMDKRGSVDVFSTDLSHHCPEHFYRQLKQLKMSTFKPYWWHTIHRVPRSSSDHPCFRLNPCTQPEPLNDKTVQKRLAALSCSLSASQRRIHFFIMGSTNIPESCVCSCLTVSKVLPGYRDRINLKHGAVVMLPYLLCIKQGDLQLYFNSVPGKAAENKSKAFQV